MKRTALIAIILSLVLPAWAAKKLTVGQLNDMVRDMLRDKKSDAEVASALQQVELGEQLTRAAMNNLLSALPGRNSTEQLYVLEARSATLDPPDSDMPSKPAPDGAAQSAILARAENYVEHTYAVLPGLLATRTTLRFQDHFEAVAASSGLVGSGSTTIDTSGFTSHASSIQFINSSAAPIEFVSGAEQPAREPDKTPWGANKMNAVQSPAPDLAAIFREARTSESLKWLRWENVNGKPAAVFSYSIPKKSSKFDVSVCCFPNIKQSGVARFYSSTTGSAIAGKEAGAGGGVTGNMQSNTNWHPFKTTTPYHGRIFVDPDSGIVVRMIAEAELKPNDLVHQLDTRIDYGPVRLGAASVVAPVASYVNMVTVPGGDSGAGTYATRCTLLTSQYSDYRKPAHP